MDGWVHPSIPLASKKNVDKAKLWNQSWVHFHHRPHSFKWSSELLVKRLFFFFSCSPHCLHPHANCWACVPTVWKGPSAVYAKSLFGKPDGRQHGSLNQIPSETFISVEGQETQCDKAVDILMIGSALGHRLDDRKQQSVFLKTVNKSDPSGRYLWIFCHFSCADRPNVLQCCFVGVERERGSVWGAGFNYAWVSAPQRVHNKAGRETERHRKHRRTERDSCWFKDWPNFKCFDASDWKCYSTSDNPTWTRRWRNERL